MLRRNPARYLAPVALVAAAVVALVIITNNVNSSSPSTPAQHVVQHSPRARRKYARAKFYIVQSGDNLGTISAKTGVSVNRLEQINPLLDPNSLQTGQRLRLRR